MFARSCARRAPAPCTRGGRLYRNRFMIADGRAFGSSPATFHKSLHKPPPSRSGGGPDAPAFRARRRLAARLGARGRRKRQPFDAYVTPSFEPSQAGSSKMRKPCSLSFAAFSAQSPPKVSAPLGQL